MMLNSRWKHLKEIKSFPKKKLKHVIFYCFNQYYDYVADMKDFYMKWLNYRFDDFSSNWVIEDFMTRSICLGVPLYGFDLRK